MNARTISEKNMRNSGPDPYSLIKNSKLLAESLDRRTRWRCLTAMVIALTAGSDLRMWSKALLHLAGL